MGSVLSAVSSAVPGLPGQLLSSGPSAEQLLHTQEAAATLINEVRELT